MELNIKPQRLAEIIANSEAFAKKCQGAVTELDKMQRAMSSDSKKVEELRQEFKELAKEINTGVLPIFKSVAKSTKILHENLMSLENSQQLLESARSSLKSVDKSEAKSKKHTKRK